MVKIIVKRSKLKDIYRTLSNEEKSKWAERAGYSNYRGLYRYVHSNPDAISYERVLLGLKEIIGEERFKNYIHESTSLDDSDIVDVVDKFCKEIIGLVADSSNEGELSQITQKLSRVEKFISIQVERIKLLDE